MLKWIIILIAFVAVISPIATKASKKNVANSTIIVDSTITTQTNRLTRKPLYPIIVPPGRSIEAISGYVRTYANTAHFSEALISLHMATSNRCPTQKQDVGDYQAINEYFPSTTLIAPIVKQAAIGAQIVPVQFQWKIPIPLPSCLFVILDGSDFSGHPYTMKAHFQIKTVPTVQHIHTDLLGVLGDEFLMSPQKRETAYKVFHIPQNMKLHFLFGNVAAIAGPGAVLRNPSGIWVAIHSVLLEHGGCSQFPHDGTYTDNSALDQFLTSPNTQLLHSVRLVGHKISSPNAPFIFQPDTPIPLKKGDCLIHGVRAIGPIAPPFLPADGINTESQINTQVSYP